MDASPGQQALFLGMNGRVGRLIRPFLPTATPLAGRRAPGPGGLAWDVMAGPGPLLALADRTGPPRALVVLSGVTPATGPDMDANVALARAAMAAAQAAGVGRVLLASSAAVYGGEPRDRPWRESDPARPGSAYGASKLAMEAAAGPFRDAGLSVCALRIGNVAGADALLLNAGAPVVLHRFADGGGPVRSYIGAATLARVLVALSEPGPALPEVLNVAAPGPVSMQALAEAAGFRWSWAAAPVAAVQTQLLDCTALAARVAIGDSEADAAGLIAQWQTALGVP